MCQSGVHRRLLSTSSRHCRVVERRDRLSKIDEDLRLWSVALVRSLTETGDRYSLESVAEEFSLDLDALDDDED